jgi:hypothetical protein
MITIPIASFITYLLLVAIGVFGVTYYLVRRKD